MDSPSLVASIDIALDKLLFQRKQSTSSSDRMALGTIILWLCAVRTFGFCSMKLAWNVKLRAEGHNDNDVPTLRVQEKKMKEKRNITRKMVESLLERVEDVVCRILDIRSPSVPDIQYEMDSCDLGMHKWYATWSVFLKKCTTSHVANQTKAIEDSVFENLKDFASPEVGYDSHQQIKSFREKIAIMRRIICFVTLLCTENQEFQCPVAQIEPLAMSAAHLEQCLFSNIEGRPILNLPSDLTSSILSALLFKFNPLLHEKYTLALPTLKHSDQELCDPTLYLSDYPFIMKMIHCIVYLSSTLLQMLKLGTIVSLKDLLLYERLRLLRILLKRQPDRFNEVKIRNLTAAIVGDAGVRIFSLCLKDSVSDQWLQCILENSEVIWEEVLEENVLETSTFNFPKTNVLGFLDFLRQDYLMEVNSSNIDSNSLSCMPKIREHLVFLKSFMGKLSELRIQQENLHQDVWNFAVHMAYKIEFLIDQLVLGDVLDSFSMSLQTITEGIMILENQGRKEIFKVQQITSPSTDKFQSISSSDEDVGFESEKTLDVNQLMSRLDISSCDEVVGDEVVGFESEKTLIVNQLKSKLKKLHVVAVVGMAGLGKTTCATKVYNDSSISLHFPVKASCSISHKFNRRKVLLKLLSQTQPGQSTLTLTDEDLSLRLWQSLKQQKYLIFIDDIWDSEAFDLLKESLPDDSKCSRILLTSRHGDVVSKDLLDDKPFFLRHLTIGESFELLQRKTISAKEDWPTKLHEFGMEIAEFCKGLPLIVVIIAGLLKSIKQENWKGILKTLRSSIVSSDQCESTIELSYKHLPDHLKPCFLWFGAFPEDHEFSVKKMIWLWISEGLIQKNESKSLEDVAREYMNNLIARSLVMDGKERSVGGVKTCRIHDLLHDFCTRKANEEYFLHVLKRNGSREQREISSGGELEALLIDETELRNLRRLSIYSCRLELLKWRVFCPRLRSLLCFRRTKRDQKLDLSYIFRMLKFLRVLVIDKVELTGFPSEIGALVQLRYLAIQVGEHVGPAIGSLSNLETLILTSTGDIVKLPDTFWNLRKLRHLYYDSVEFPIDDSNSSSNLLELQTLSSIRVTDWSVLKNQLRKFPNIRQMRLTTCDDDGCVNISKVMDFSFLIQLESLSSLSIRYSTSAPSPELIFPINIKKLMLQGTEYQWDQIASIAKLPNLEVLKLRSLSFSGGTWHVEEGDFLNLKFLKLEELNLLKWTAASDELFFNLEKLELIDCCELIEVPECLENAPKLDTIEVIRCSDRVVSQLRSVEEFQKEMGNSSLQFHERGTFSYVEPSLDFLNNFMKQSRMMALGEHVPAAEIPAEEIEGQRYFENAVYEFVREVFGSPT